MIIFLDIDGVLNDHKQHDNGFCGIKPQCATVFNRLLCERPTAKIVLSSAWRYMVTRGEITLKGFEHLLQTHGIECADRLVGHTREDHSIEEHRWHQINDWIEQHSVEHWICIDDLRVNRHEKRCYQTNGNIGITGADVDAILQIFPALL